MEGLQYHRAGFDESMNNSASTPFLGPMGQSMTFAPLYASNMIGIDTSFLASADNDMNTFQSHSLTAHDQQPRAIISTANNNPSKLGTINIYCFHTIHNWATCVPQTQE